VPPPAWWLLVAWYGGTIAALWGGHRRFVRRAALVVLAASAWLLIGNPSVSRAVRVDPAPPGWTRVVFMDVGQGDAALVSTPGAAPMLIDAGGVAGSGFDLGRRVTVPVCWAFGVTRLSRLVLTHPDPDHIGGAPAVIRALRPGEIMEGVPVPSHLPLHQVRALADARHVRWLQAFAPISFAHRNLAVRVLNPPPPEWERRKVRNDDSLVLVLQVNDVAFVLPGDISQAVERDVLGDFAPAPLVIVKAPHHGSAGSSSPAFIERIHPAAVVFSAGRRNAFGHPSPIIVDRYRSAGAVVLRTDEDGAIVVDTDGRRVVIWTWTGKRLELTAAAGAPSSAATR
jgi:competence protein ComEC